MASNHEILFARNFFYRLLVRGFDRNIYGITEILFSRHFFCGFVPGFHRNTWLRWDLVCSHFFCRFVPGFHIKIWHQIMRFLFARNFFYRLLVRGFDRNMWHQWDVVWSTFLLLIRSRILQKNLASVRSCLLTFLRRISSRNSQIYMASSMRFLFAWNFFRGFDRGFHRNNWHHSDFVCSTFLLRSTSRIGQKYMASMRFFLLEISSADQIEHLAEILFGVNEISFPRHFFCVWVRGSDRKFICTQGKLLFECWYCCWQ